LHALENKAEVLQWWPMKLANRTQKSTDQIRGLIEKLQAGSSDAVNVMSDALSQVDENSEHVKQVSVSLTDIASEVDSIN